MLLPFRPLPPAPMHSPHSKSRPVAPSIYVRTGMAPTWRRRSSSPVTPDSPSSPLHSPSSSRPNSRPTTPSDVHNAVSRLLGLTKQLQELLQLWGMRHASEDQVSDAFVLVGQQFNATVDVFWRHNVDMSDLFHVLTDLREVLETCLGEDASPQTLAYFMPQVRLVIYNLLTGLRSKQGPYWSAVSGRRRSTRSLEPSRQT